MPYKNGREPLNGDSIIAPTPDRVYAGLLHSLSADGISASIGVPSITAGNDAPYAAFSLPIKVADCVHAEDALAAMP